MGPCSYYTNLFDRVPKRVPEKPHVFPYLSHLGFLIFPFFGDPLPFPFRRAVFKVDLCGRYNAFTTTNEAVKKGKSDL